MIEVIVDLINSLFLYSFTLKYSHDRQGWVESMIQELDG